MPGSNKQQRKGALANEWMMEGQLAADGKEGKHPEFKGNVAKVYSNLARSSRVCPAWRMSKATASSGGSNVMPPILAISRRRNIAADVLKCAAGLPHLSRSSLTGRIKGRVPVASPSATRRMVPWFPDLKARRE